MDKWFPRQQNQHNEFLKTCITETGAMCDVMKE